MTRFVQPCASKNDLFALDDEGDVYQYHFNVKTWVKLIATRELEERRPGGAAQKDGSAGWREGRPGGER